MPRALGRGDRRTPLAFTSQLDEAKHVVTFMGYPAAHHVKIHSTKPPQAAEQAGHTLRERGLGLPEWVQHYAPRRHYPYGAKRRLDPGELRPDPGGISGDSATLRGGVTRDIRTGFPISYQDIKRLAGMLPIPCWSKQPHATFVDHERPTHLQVKAFATRARPPWSFGRYPTITRRSGSALRRWSFHAKITGDDPNMLARRHATEGTRTRARQGERPCAHSI